MPADIRIGVIGRVIAGVELNRFVKIVDDRENTGGFLVLTAADDRFREDGADAWVESETDLSAYFDESEWDVVWLD